MSMARCLRPVTHRITSATHKVHHHHQDRGDETGDEEYGVIGFPQGAEPPDVEVVDCFDGGFSHDEEVSAYGGVPM